MLSVTEVSAIMIFASYGNYAKEKYSTTYSINNNTKNKCFYKLKKGLHSK